MAVTADCIDPVFNEKTFKIDKLSEQSAPVAHTRVDAHFAPEPGQPPFKVTLYLPPADKWQGRFFQHAYPLQQPENLSDVAFALRNGGYLVNVAGVPCGCGGYRPDAAAAKLAKSYAANFYKSNRRIYGYLWGGSGGGLVTSGAAENTSGVWDGIIPYVMPNAASLANVNAITALASLALGPKLNEISDAVAPGSGKSPMTGLTAEQQAILSEALALGLPISTLESPGIMAAGTNPLLLLLSAGVKKNDPGFVTDFWSKPGYEGANPPDFLMRAKREEWATVTEVSRDETGKLVSVRLDRTPEFPPGPFSRIGFEYWLYQPDGRTKVGELGGSLVGDTIQLRPSAAAQSGQLGQGVEAQFRRASVGDIDKVAPGDKVNVNNLYYLALNFYHRHAMPLDRDMYVYDVLRRPDGTPRYPQRSFRVATDSAVTTSGGGTQTGKITSKVMVMQSIVDGGAQPWMADWYAKRVRKALGSKGFADNFRIYINDNAGHVDAAPNGAQGASLIEYVPALRQALLDLSAWVERGVAPPQSSAYRMNAGQMVLAPSAASRQGLQPVVDLKVAGKDRIVFAAGQPVTFKGVIAAPPRAGMVTQTAWWFGDTAFKLAPEVVRQPTKSVSVKATHVFAKPGTYFVTLWATAQRQGSIDDSMTAIQNLDRVRVIVK